MRASVLATQALRLDPRVHLGRGQAGVARAAPGSSAGRPPLRADGSRTSAAGCAARRARRPPPGAPIAPAGAARPTGTGAGPGARGTGRAPSGPPPTRAAPSRGSAPGPAARGSPIGTIRVFEPLPVTLRASDSNSVASRSQVDDLLGPKPAGVGELEQGAVADLQRPGGRDPLEKGGDLPGPEDTRKARAALRARQELAGIAARRLRRGSGNRGGCARRPACGRRWTAPGRAPTARRHTRAGPGGRARRAHWSPRVAHSASSARSLSVGPDRVPRGPAGPQLAPKALKRRLPRRADVVASHDGWFAVSEPKPAPAASRRCRSGCRAGPGRTAPRRPGSTSAHTRATPRFRARQRRRCRGCRLPRRSPSIVP